MIGLTKRSHVAPKIQHVTFCDSIVRFVLCLMKRIDTVRGVTWIRWGRGEGKTLSIHVVSTQCARGLGVSTQCARGLGVSTQCARGLGVLYIIWKVFESTSRNRLVCLYHYRQIDFYLKCLMLYINGFVSTSSTN